MINAFIDVVAMTSIINPYSVISFIYYSQAITRDYLSYNSCYQELIIKSMTAMPVQEFAKEPLAAQAKLVQLVIPVIRDDQWLVLKPRGRLNDILSFLLLISYINRQVSVVIIVISQLIRCFYSIAMFNLALLNLDHL